MTQPPNNPPNDQRAAEPGKALRIARLLIALGLCAGITVFAVFTIEELKAGVTTYAPPTDFGAADASPDTPMKPTPGSNPLAGQLGPDPGRYPLINRPNRHPGEIMPFKGTAPLGQPPYYQAKGGEVWEFCVYERPDTSLTDLIAYYNDQAKQKGMRFIKQRPTGANIPGGIEATWSDGQNHLVVTISPRRVAEPVQPPLAQPTPLRWVVKYSYPNQP